MSRSRNALIFTLCPVVPSPRRSSFLAATLPKLPFFQRNESVVFPSSTVFLSFGLVISKLRPFPPSVSSIVSRSPVLLLTLPRDRPFDLSRVSPCKNTARWPRAIGIRYSFRTEQQGWLPVTSPTYWRRFIELFLSVDPAAVVFVSPCTHWELLLRTEAFHWTFDTWLLSLTCRLLAWNASF